MLVKTNGGKKNEIEKENNKRYMYTMKKLVDSYPKDPKFYYKKMNQKIKPYNDIKINLYN